MGTYFEVANIPLGTVRAAAAARDDPMLDRVLRAVVDENEGREDDYVLSFIYVGCIYGSGRVDFAARHQLHIGGKSGSVFGRFAACIKETEAQLQVRLSSVFPPQPSASE
jgi:hypothetical protein